jgi:GNAT superfamily N-acetyltransferase
MGTLSINTEHECVFTLTLGTESHALCVDGKIYPVELHYGNLKKSLTAYDCGKFIAGFSWQEDSGKIVSVWVHKNYRRQGIATALLRLARRIQPITMSGARTDDGDAWARSLSESLPERLPS